MRPAACIDKILSSKCGNISMSSRGNYKNAHIVGAILFISDYSTWMHSIIIHNSHCVFVVNCVFNIC